MGNLNITLAAMAQRCLFVFCIVMVTGCIAAPMEDQIVPEGTSLVDVTERGGCLSSYNNRYGACSKTYCDKKEGQYGCPCKASTAAPCYDDGGVSVTCNGGGFCVNCEPNMNGFAGCPCSKGLDEPGTCTSQAGQGNDFSCLQTAAGYWCSTPPPTAGTSYNIASDTSYN